MIDHRGIDITNWLGRRGAHYRARGAGVNEASRLAHLDYLRSCIEGADDFWELKTALLDFIDCAHGTLGDPL
jgi:hypothetical protein